MIGVLVGLSAEARLIQKVLPSARIALSGATREGAERGLAELKAAHAEYLLSFGCAGGLAPDVNVGDIVVPQRVFAHGHYYESHVLPIRLPARRCGFIRSEDLYHSDTVITKASEKQRLWHETRCIAVDMESGVVAAAGLPFGVLRVICDVQDQDLPPAVAAIMTDGQVSFSKLISSLLRRPKQIPALVRLGRHAARARRKMSKMLRGAHYT